MISQEKGMQRVELEDVIDEADELLCLENAEELVIDSSFKSPDMKPKNDLKVFGFQLNGLDSANLNTQLGAENIENKSVSEITKFESDL